MKIFKHSLLLLTFYFISAAIASGQSSSRNYLAHKDWNFIENKGQLADETGRKLSEIKFYGRQGNIYIYCKPGTVSFVFSKIENDRSVSEATGQSPADRLAWRQAMMKQSENGTGKRTFSRTDLVLTNANLSADILATDQQQYFENFYTASTDANGILGAHSFKTVTYQNIYPHIDLVLHTRECGMKYEFVVHPGGAVSDIQLHWNGSSSMAILQNGGIKYTNPLGEMTESQPISFTGNGLGVESKFVKNKNCITFKTAGYDKSRTLTIDPTLDWSTYLGGGTVDNTQAMWLDHSGNIVVTGQTASSSGIATSGAFLTSYSGTGAANDNDAFISKFTSSGGILWSTYYGYTGYDDGWAINVDSYDNIFFIGTTGSKSNIATSGSYQSLIGGTGSATYNAYIVKFTPNGSRFWATYFGNSGLDQGLFMALDGSNNIFITCWITSSSGIATSGAYQTAFGGAQDASVEKFDSTGVKLLWSTYFGGSGSESVNTIACDNKGNAIICGSTPSTSGIASSGGYQTGFGGSMDAFIASFSSSGGLNWATYLGGSGNDYGWGVETDASANVIVCGQTYSTSGIASSGAYQKALSGTANAFVTKFSVSGALVWSTYYGGNGTDAANNLSVDATNNILVTGSTTSSSGFATSCALQSAIAGSGDGFLAKFLPNGSPTYVSYFGGSGNDFGWDIKETKTGDIYLTGGSASSSGIATSGAYQTANGGSTDAFLVKFSFHIYVNDAGISQILAPNSSFCIGSKTVSVRLTNFGNTDLKKATIGWSINQSVQSPYSWSGTLKKDSSINVTLGSYSFPSGLDTIKSWTSSPNGFLDSVPCNDTARIRDTVSSYPKPSAGGNKGVCPGSGTNIGSTTISGHKYSWTSNPAGFTSTAANVVVSPTITTAYYLTETNTTGGCTTKDTAVVTVNPAPSANAGGGKSVCYGGNVSLGTSAVKNHTYAWSSVPTGFTSTLSNPVANPTTNTTYYVTEIDTTTGCFAYDNAYILVTAPGKANGGGNQSICSGGSFTLGVTAVTGHTYSWTSKPSGFTSTASNPSSTTTVNTVYYLTEKITSNGCTLLDSSTISVNPLPVPVTGGNQTVCALSNTVLGSKAVTGYTYSWVSKPSGFTSSKSNPTANPASNTTYYETVTNTSTGCYATDSAIIKTNPLPPANAGGNHAICSGDNYQVGVGSTSGYTYSWLSKPAGFTNNLSNPFVSPGTTTTYFVTETNTATGCSATDSAIITVNVILAHAGGNHTICKGKSITIGQSPVSGDSYAWSSSAGGFSSSQSDPEVTPTATTTYYLIEGNLTTGCSKTDSAIIIVNPLPAAYAIANTSVCLGSSISLGDVPVNNNIYSWISKPAGFTASASNPNITPVSSATYYLTETIQSTGCTKTDSVTVIVKPLPVVHFKIDYFGNITYLHASDSSLNDAAYKWKFGDGDSATGHLATHLYQKNKPYNVSLRITGSNGCVKQLDTSVSVTVSGINFSENNGFGLSVFPNPFGNATTVTYNLDKNASVRISLVDITGKQIGLITDEKQNPGKYSVDINTAKYNLEAGIYFVKFAIDGEMMTRQVVKMGY